MSASHPSAPLRSAAQAKPHDPASMRALALTEGGVRLEVCDRPRLEAPDDVLIRVQAAGLCRTDLYVAAGELPAPPGIVLGHEAAGFVSALGSGLEGGPLQVGALVGIDPRVPCGSCAACAPSPSERGSGAPLFPDRCLQPKQLGIDLDGVFAEHVSVPAACLYPIEEGVSPLRAAYLEPVAAAMGALEAGLRPRHVGVVAGEGRIAELTARVLEYAGLPRPRILRAPSLEAELPAGTLDYVIDAGLPSDEALAQMTNALRKGGTLVLKSRAAAARSFTPAHWVAREITVAARAYGSFQDAARAVADPRLHLEDLFGTPRPLSDFEGVFRAARASEGVKQFFDLTGVPRVH